MKSKRGVFKIVLSSLIILLMCPSTAFAALDKDVGTAAVVFLRMTPGARKAS